MKKQVVTILAGLSLAASAYAFPCFVTLAKDNCWTNYDVKVTVMDAVSNQQMAEITVPAGKTWFRQGFVCQPGQKLMYLASFSPVIWQKDAGKTYHALQYWSLPATISSGETAWNIPVCYARDFAEVPLPPDASGQCQCNFSNIPPVPPQ